MTSFGVPIFGTRVYLAMDKSEAQKWEDARGCDVSIGDADGICSESGGRILIYIKRADMAILAHECLHAAYATLEHIGDESRDEEVVANLLQHIMAECVKRIDNCTNQS